MIQALSENPWLFCLVPLVCLYLLGEMIGGLFFYPEEKPIKIVATPPAIIVEEPMPIPQIVKYVPCEMVKVSPGTKVFIKTNWISCTCGVHEAIISDFVIYMGHVMKAKNKVERFEPIRPLRCPNCGKKVSSIDRVCKPIHVDLVDPILPEPVTEKTDAQPETTTETTRFSMVDL